MAKGAYGTTDGDWDATWDCVGSPMLNSQRFQYQITVDQKKRSFIITARRYPAGDGKGPYADAVRWCSVSCSGSS
jgi:hypothetical protein